MLQCAEMNHGVTLEDLTSLIVEDRSFKIVLVIWRYNYIVKKLL